MLEVASEHLNDWVKRIKEFAAAKSLQERGEKAKHQNTTNN